ncbi:MAG TPA: RluA family pseudouridine synthase [Methylibium sp.]
MRATSSSEPDRLQEIDEEAAEPQAAEVERRCLRVDEAAHGLRLDKLLVTMAGEFSRSHLQNLIAQGHVRLAGQVQTTASRKVQLGQEVEVDLLPTEQSKAFCAEAVPLAIVYEDEHLMVVDKPAGLVVHPAAGNWSGTLLNGLLHHHAGAANLPRAGIVHRLDKDTSGLMVVGKTLAAVTALVREIGAREVRREYLALAHGAVADEAFSIDAPIGRDPVSRVRMAVLASGKPARTDVQRIAVGEALGQSGVPELASALRCRLHTGRTHQIRVHLAHQGHPLVGDTLYGGRRLLGLQRQALHAARLSFTHPASGRPMDFEAALPPDLAAAWQRLLGSR